MFPVLPDQVLCPFFPVGSSSNVNLSAVLIFPGVNKASIFGYMQTEHQCNYKGIGLWNNN